MSISAVVKEVFRSERDKGHTYQKIADKLNLDQSYVVNLSNGKRSFEGITLGTFDRMFPHATVDLEGHAPIRAARVASPGDGDITYGDRSEALRSAIIGEVIDLDIPPECLAKVLKAVKHARA